MRPDKMALSQSVGVGLAMSLAAILGMASASPAAGEEHVGANDKTEALVITEAMSYGVRQVDRERPFQEYEWDGLAVMTPFARVARFAYKERIRPSYKHPIFSALMQPVVEVYWPIESRGQCSEIVVEVAEVPSRSSIVSPSLLEIVDNWSLRLPETPLGPRLRAVFGIEVLRRGHAFRVKCADQDYVFEVTERRIEQLR